MGPPCSPRAARPTAAMEATRAAPAMEATRTARASSLATLRQAYVPGTGESRADDEKDWPVFGAQDFSCTDTVCVEAKEDSSDESMESEWNAVAARTDTFRLEQKANFGKIQPKEESSSALISYKEVQAWISRQVFSEASQTCAAPKVLQPLENRGSEGFTGLLRKRQLRGGKDLVVHLRAMPFDFNTPTHFQMLRTIYTKLTANKWCPSVGGHWEVLGFQAGDPRTDLNRSGGVLNVLHMFFFVAHHLDLAIGCFRLSQDDRHNFPLACISINITHMVIESLAAGRLSALCSKESSDKGVLEMLCRMHSASLAYFCARWRSQKRTIEDTAQTLNELKTLLNKKPAKLLEELAKGPSKKAAASPTPEFADLEAIGGVSKVQVPLMSQRSGFWARSKAAVLPKRLRCYQDENADA